MEVSLSIFKITYFYFGACISSRDAVGLLIPIRVLISRHDKLSSRRTDILVSLSFG